MFSEEHRMTTFQNREWRKILGPKKEEVTGERRGKNGVMKCFYSSSITVTRLQKRHVAYMGRRCTQDFGRNT
jgi:hypothetical protein